MTVPHDRTTSPATHVPAEAGPAAPPGGETLHYTDTTTLPAAEKPVQILAGYEILGELGRGGMGVVYKARQTGLVRIVALKMILHADQASAEDHLRFLREPEALARLKHENIVQIYEIGEHDGKPFISLEYVEGGSLDQQLKGTPLPPQDAAALVEKLASAMQAAHAQGIIQRDLKPANVLLAEARGKRQETRGKWQKNNNKRSSASRSRRSTHSASATPRTWTRSATARRRR